jgi:glucosamine--fructose-6-phosphate aminotransferase (isomerizing)
VNELMLREMQSQPNALAEALSDLRIQAAQIALPRVDRIVLTGSGDSGYAAMALEHAYQATARVPVWALSSASASRFGELRVGGLTVVISVSGEVIRTIEAAQAARAAGGTVVAVTAAGSSTLVGVSDAALVMPKPITRATPHTRDYTLTLLALAVILEWVTDRRMNELDEWPGQVAEVLERAMRWAEDLPRLEEERQPIFLGLGPDRGTAAYAALKFWEAGGMRALWDDLEEFGHGSQLVAMPGDQAVVFATGRGASRAAEMLPGLARMGLTPIVVADARADPAALLSLTEPFQLPELDPNLVGLLSCIPVQAITYIAANRRQIDVTVPLGGRPEGPIFDAVHVEWMRQSQLEPPAEKTAQGN